jgi:small subunit ribosomal protein S27Ae
MSILKYYKVDSDGKIKRLRRECPTAECGAGIFVRALTFWQLEITDARRQMAFHKDRQYCGKCGLTYTFAPGTKPTA